MFIRDFKDKFFKNKENRFFLENTKMSSTFMLTNKFKLNNKKNIRAAAAIVYIFLKNFKHNKNIAFLECLTLILVFFNKSNSVDYFFVKKNIGKYNLDYKDIILKKKNFLQKYVACNVLNVKGVGNYFVNISKSQLVKIKSKNTNKIKFQNSSIVKYLLPHNVEKLETMFLRKNRIYNKGRYSRCRQNYRTGVYLCMYLSVISIFGLYYWFFKFSFQFTYLWWVFIVFVGSFFVPKIIKYRLYEPSTLATKFLDFFK